MNTDFALTGIGSMIMDILPVVLMIMLAGSFFKKRSEMKKEETELNETIQILESTEGCTK